MNDFTKDELLIIHLDMCTYVAQNKILNESPIHRKLREKIESMIDNYCEHSHRQYYERVNVYECENCQMVML